MRAKILIVDDDPELVETLTFGLEARGHDCQGCGSADEVVTALNRVDEAVVITDMRMPNTSGIDLCRMLRTNYPGVPVILMTAFGDMDNAIAAMRAGAIDFINKPFPIDELELVLSRALHIVSLNATIKALRDERPQTAPTDEYFGTSESMIALAELVERAAKSNETILLRGESGTGKEFVARRIHTLRSAERPFVPVNCAAIPDNLFESELFGAEKGAFTGADRSREGMLREAKDGTVFLDEIAELPPATQSKLLRALQEKKVRPVGGDREVAFAGKIIAATHQSLSDLVSKKEFREDLYYRLNVLTIEIPPLRERGADIIRLAQKFLRASEPSRSLSHETKMRLLKYRWPGNVRELQNAIKAASVMSDGHSIRPRDLPESICNENANDDIISAADDAAGLVTMADLEARYMEKVLRVVSGNKSKAAEILGFNRKTLYRKMKKYGLQD